MKLEEKEIEELKTIVKDFKQYMLDWGPTYDFRLFKPETGLDRIREYFNK